MSLAKLITDLMKWIGWIKTSKPTWADPLFRDELSRQCGMFQTDRTIGFRVKLMPQETPHVFYFLDADGKPAQGVCSASKGSRAVFKILDVLPRLRVLPVVRHETLHAILKVIFGIHDHPHELPNGVKLEDVLGKAGAEEWRYS